MSTIQDRCSNIRTLVHVAVVFMVEINRKRYSQMVNQSKCNEQVCETLASQPKYHHRFEVAELRKVGCDSHFMRC